MTALGGLVQTTAGQAASALGFDVPTLLYFAAGLIGTFLRAAMSATQRTWSAHTWIDVALGGFVGVVYPLYPVIPLADTATVVQKASLILLASFASSVLLRTVLWRSGVLKDDPRPPEGEKP